MIDKLCIVDCIVLVLLYVIYQKEDLLERLGRLVVLGLKNGDGVKREVPLLYENVRLAGV